MTYYIELYTYIHSLKHNINCNIHVIHGVSKIKNTFDITSGTKPVIHLYIAYMTKTIHVITAFLNPPPQYSQFIELAIVIGQPLM